MEVGQIVTCIENFHYKLKDGKKILVAKDDIAKIFSINKDNNTVSFDVIKSQNKQSEGFRVILTRFEFNILFDWYSLYSV